MCTCVHTSTLVDLALKNLKCMLFEGAPPSPSCWHPYPSPTDNGHQRTTGALTLASSSSCSCHKHVRARAGDGTRPPSPKNELHVEPSLRPSPRASRREVAPAAPRLKTFQNRGLVMIDPRRKLATTRAIFLTKPVDKPCSSSVPVFLPISPP